MKQKLRIAVLGPIPRDTIKTHRGEVIKKYGCVTHPAIALANLLENEGEVIPVSHVHQEDLEPIKNLFSPYSNISTEGIYTDKNMGTVINLEFLDQNNRQETQSSRMAPISPEDVAPFLDVDAFVLVPITDFEIPLETLKYIRENSDARVIFDAHGPTSWVTEEGKRLRRIWKEKYDWFPWMDVLKMNLEESQFSWFENENILTDYNEELTEHLDDFAYDTLKAGVKLLYVTLDSRGCATYRMHGTTMIKEWVSSVKVNEVIDTTGCGDSFAGGLAYGLVTSNDPANAARFGNVLGALRTQGRGFDVFKKKEETLDILRNNYGSTVFE
ncbi:carbohydrate kinase family protein [Robertkochia marina]|uniref:Carbohydrate kinase family protein n=1 Tax=Robertkochia marina TaxID=1227945 RepID=A0A4S3LY92_9FLAO|nr:carbohydrate kinase family protein [Robertkochia marina]THD66549.1 carbohydrate kinase family protein [Robertkochia marina]TRZ45610.1 carbohydrate kinase family protein [Robertkochia marina]